MKTGKLITKDDNLNEFKIAKPEVITFVEDSLEFGCDVYIDSTSISIYTKEGSIDKIHEDGHLIFAMFNITSNNMTQWHTWYEFDEGRQQALRDYGNDSSFKEVYDSCMIELDKCPKCGEMVGLENMKTYGFAGRACEKCVKEAYNEFEREVGPRWTF